MKQNVIDELSGRKTKRKLKINTPPFYGSLGLFVTLKRGRKVRGCYGAFVHSSASIERVLRDYLRGALTGDHRYEPLQAHEIEDVEIIITVASIPGAVNSIHHVNLDDYGVVLTCDNRGKRVFVPAEVRTSSYINRYLRGRHCEIGAFRAVTVR